jgi:serine/threonine protein kinase
MLYEMVTGRPPFVGDESVAIITQHLNTPPVAPSWHNPELPERLEALILQLLEKDASRRPSSATEVREQLASVALTPARMEPGQSLLPNGEGGSEGRAQNPLYRRIFVGREAEQRQLQQGDGASVTPK